CAPRRGRRRPAAARRRPRRAAHRRGARAPRRALPPPLRPDRGPPRPRGLRCHGLSRLLRTGLLCLGDQPRIFRFIRGNGLARRCASRFVAGETVDSGVAALKTLNAAGITASLDMLGESVHTAAEAHAARDTYLETLDRIRAAGAAANVSLKLTQMGLDIDERLCVENLRAIIARAQGYGSFVRIDMEQSE